MASPNDPRARGNTSGGRPSATGPAPVSIGSGRGEPGHSSGSGTLPHAYGPRVTLLDSPSLATRLARLSAPECGRGELLRHVRAAYVQLVHAALDRIFPRTTFAVDTRMAASAGAAARLSGIGLDPATQVVLVDVIRGGIVPAQECFELLTELLPEQHLRLDHLNLARRSDAAGRVTGVDLTGSKIGGPVDGAWLILPDPMGATGGTTVRVLEHYFEHHGRPQELLLLPMIATPEYLRRVLDFHPSLQVVVGRLDRGLSAPDVLASMPGSRWSEERGLDGHSYIVPGAGGIGELLNNSWV
jgi:uracil phosphoribosyltransferase